MKFIDEAIIKVRAGHGGAGSRSFRREKFVPLGGPNGGNGGRGGSVLIVADASKQTLIDFTAQTEWFAKDGKPGSGQLKDGSAGEDLVIHVPTGTQILNAKDNSLIVDLSTQGQSFIIAKGGRGGKGNNFFKSATNQAPQHAQPGEPGEEGIYKLSLKLLADVALVGMPNAGKSTLISRISAARPKIADYPFTTLTPNLGVVRYDQNFSFVVADIPGLIPDAHKGKGLGIGFLKHIERTNLILHLLDCSSLVEEAESLEALEEVKSKFKTINHELQVFSPELAQKKQLVVLTKIDALAETHALAKLKAELEGEDLEVFPISSISGKGLPELLHRIAALIKSEKLASV